MQVLQQDANDNIVTNYIATMPCIIRRRVPGSCREVKVVSYDAAGNITQIRTSSSPLRSPTGVKHLFGSASANMRAEYLSVPELRDYLQFNSDFPETLLAPFATHLQYRLALPWTCLVVVFIAAPLAIGFSRRGVLSSVATAIIGWFSP